MTIPPSSPCLPISWSGDRGEARSGGRRHHGARRRPPRDRARTRARDAARARAVRGGRPAGRHDRDQAARGLSRGAGPRLVSLREALGPRPLSPSWHRGPAHPHRRSLPPHLRGVRWPPPCLARGLPAPRAHSPRAFRPLGTLLLDRQAQDGHGSRSAPRRRSRGKPGRLRIAAAGPGGARARCPAPGRRHLHGGSRHAFARGMEELVRALASRLPADTIHLGRRVTSVTREGMGWRLGMADGTAVNAERVIIATESHHAARMLRYTDPGLSHLLEGITYASSATVTLGWRRSDIPHPLDGFGFVVPRAERRSIIACTFSSVKYAGRAPEGFALLRGFVGGALNESALDGDDDTLIQVARTELGEILGIQAPPLLSRVSRHPKAMPQYHVGHLARADAIEGCLRAHPGLALAGGAYRGVGIADCIRSGEDAAARLLEAG